MLITAMMLMMFMEMMIRVMKTAGNTTIVIKMFDEGNEAGNSDDERDCGSHVDVFM